MREHKYRAWDGEEMRYTFSVQSNGDGVLYSGVIVDWKLMQFTGLKDKKGKEIYEGDIMSSTYGNGEPSIIKFGEYPDKQGSTNIGFYILKGGYFQVGFGNSVDGDTNCFEVIGNIYENPDLLS